MEITWKRFAAKNADTTESFQALASYIYCQQIGAKFKNAPKNYPGLEAKPHKGKDGKTYGYQAKYFDVQDAKTQRQQLIKTLGAVKTDDIKALDTLKLYINETASGVENDVTKVWDAQVTKVQAGKKVPIEWFVGINTYQVELDSSDYYSHLKAVLFSGGEPARLQGSNVSQDVIKELFGKPFFLDLPLSDEKGSLTLEKLIGDTKSKVILIKARAGAGKSILLQRFSYKASGLDKSYSEQQKLIIDNGIYIRLNAQEFINNSALDLISRRLETYGIKLGEYPLRLLIDSLDEVAESDSRILCQNLQHLVANSTITQVISCSREASKNAVIFNQLLSPRAVHIEKLDDATILAYFKARKNATKTTLLKQAIKEGVDIDLLRDVRMLELAWQVVKYNNDFQKAVLMEKRFKSQAANARLAELNLLQPQEAKIEKILETQGYLLQTRETYDFPLRQIQAVIEKQNPKLTYRDVNDTVGKLKDICVDNVSGLANVLQFEHRSWADYFAARYLTRRFLAKKSLLRELAPYEDFLKEWFIPVARNFYRGQDNLIACISVGIIEFYLKGYLDRTDENDEFSIKISIGKHHPALKEQIEAELREKVESGYISPGFALVCHDAGFEAIATKVHQAILKGLDEKDKGVYDTVWNQLPEFYKLQLIYKKQLPEDIFERTQRLIYNQLRSGRGWRSDLDGLSGKLTDILNSLVQNGTTTAYILENARKRLHYSLFPFFVEPGIAREIMSNEELKTNLLGFYAGNTEDRVAIQGIFGKDFTQKQKDLAKKHLNKMREENHRRETLSYEYQVKIYAFKRILGYTEWEGAAYKHEHNDILTTENIFENIFYFSVMNFQPDKLGDFTVWLKDSPIYNRTLSRNYEFPIIRASTHLVVELLIKLPFTAAQKLLNDLQETDNSIINMYTLAIQLHAKDEDRFKSLFSYDDVFKLIDTSKQSLEDYLTSISDLGGLLAMFEPDKAMSLLYELKRETRLRYGYHKDGLGFFLTDALETMWREKLYSYKGLVERTELIYELIIGIGKITDGSAVSWLPDYFFETLTKEDMKLAERLYEKYLKEQYYDIGLLTIMLLAQVNRGDEYEKIVAGIRKYQPYYMQRDHIGEPYFESKFIVFMEVVSQENKYSQEDRLNALKQAGEQLASLIKQEEENWKYYPQEDNKKLARAIEFYKKYKKTLKQPKLPVYPEPRRSPDPLDTSEYKSKKEKSSTETKQILESAQSKEEIMRLVDGLNYKIKLDVDYKYLLCTKEPVQRFIEKLYEFGVSFQEVKELVSRTIEPWSYGKGSQEFVFALWKYPYREEFRNYLMNSTHQSDVSTLLKMFINESENELARSLIDEVCDCIKLLIDTDKKD